MKNFRATCALGALCALSFPAFAVVDVILGPVSQSTLYGVPATITVNVTGPCAEVQALAGQNVQVLDPFLGGAFSMTMPATACAAGSTATQILSFSPAIGPMTARALRVSIGGLLSSPSTVSSSADVLVQGPGDSLRVAVNRSSNYSACNQRQITQLAREESPYLPIPPNIRTPYEITSFNLSNCTLPPGNVFSVAGSHSGSFVLGFPEPITPGARVFVYDRRTTPPRWNETVPGCVGPGFCAAVVEPHSYTFSPDIWFDVLGSPDALQAGAVVAFPQRDARASPLQDLWWSGVEESGWGLNIAKMGERIFATLFAYDQEGKPQWVVLPSGQWDPVHNVYYGDAYIPKGSAFSAYDPTKFVIGDAVGTMSLSFSGDDVGHLDYVIKGVQGGKRLLRYEFAKRADFPAPYPGMWWGGGAQNGWGLSIQQQGDTLFVTWYTYDANGNPTWFFMPAGQLTTTGKYSGPLYRTTGTPWSGRRFYDGSKTQVTQVGTMQLDFTVQDKATMTASVNGTTVTQVLTRFDF
jgi:hypothetical protein